MTDELKASMLSVAQFRAQLERQMYDIENHLILELRACEGKQSAIAALARLDGFYAMKGEVIAGYAEARQASAWQPIESAPKDGTRILLARKQLMSGELTVVSGSWNRGGAFSGPYWQNGMNLQDPTLWMPLPLAPPVLEDDAHE